MAADIESPRVREIIVTNIDWLFDFGIKESLTLYDTDTVEYNAAEHTVDIVLAPRTPEGFPEYITYHVGKIIGQHTQQARLKVGVPDHAWRQPKAASASGPVPAGRAGRPTAHSASSAPVAPVDQMRHSPRAPRELRGRAPRSTPTYDSQDQVPAHTSGSWKGDDQTGTEA